MGAGILGFVVGESCHRWEPSPVILLIVEKGSEVGFHRAVLLLGLAVGLCMEGGEEPSLVAC